LAVSTTEIQLYFTHAFTNGNQFLKRCAALGLPFLWASPAGFSSFSSLFSLQHLRSKRKQLLFLQCCAASVALRFFAVRARRQVRVTRVGFWL
jgi:hypothetical protein